eukprot:5757985-Amphidinium_carterae.1
MTSFNAAGVPMRSQLPSVDGSFVHCNGLDLQLEGSQTEAIQCHASNIVSRKEELRLFINDVLDRNMRSKAEAATLKGRMQFYDAQELDVAARFAVETAAPLTEGSVALLNWALLLLLPPRVIHYASGDEVWLVFTDACYEQSIFWIGWSGRRTLQEG